jgi:inorganic pyrophosphatase
MNIWHDFPAERISPEKFISVIEIPKGSKKKYEIDKETGMIFLDRILFTSTHYPANYGFIPRTLSQDDDPLDVLVLCQESLDPLTLVECYPIGVLNMIDNDDIDEKVIAIPFGDPSLNSFQDIDELPGHQFHEIRHFFEVYKHLEDKVTLVERIMDRRAAEKVISDCMKRYSERFESQISAD